MGLAPSIPARSFSLEYNSKLKVETEREESGMDQSHVVSVCGVVRGTVACRW